MEVADIRRRAADVAARLTREQRDELAVAALTIRLSAAGLETSYRRQVVAVLSDLAPTMSKAVHALLRTIPKGT